MPEDPKAALVARLNTLATQMQQQQVANAPISPAQLKELRDITAAVGAYTPPPPDPPPEE